MVASLNVGTSSERKDGSRHSRWWQILVLVVVANVPALVGIEVLVAVITDDSTIKRIGGGRHSRWWLADITGGISSDRIGVGGRYNRY